MNSNDCAKIIGEKFEAIVRACSICSGNHVRSFSQACETCNAMHAKISLEVTRVLNLPRAPLYVPGEKAPKGKGIALGPIAKRVAEMKKKHKNLSAFDAARIELNVLLARRYELEAA